MSSIQSGPVKTDFLLHHMDVDIQDGMKLETKIQILEVLRCISYFVV